MKKCFKEIGQRVTGAQHFYLEDSKRSVHRKVIIVCLIVINKNVLCLNGMHYLSGH